MGFKLSEVQTDEEFLPLWLAFRDGFTNPGNALWPLFMGDWDPEDPKAREAALHESCARFVSWHRADPTSTWLKVTDEDTGEIAAGGRWSIFTSGKPYDGHAPFEAAWFAQGEPRQVGTKLVNDFLSTAAKNANRPHAFLNILFTTPKYRRQGAASLIMDWGFEKAKLANLEVYIEATREGKPLYEKYGLKAIQQSSFAFDTQEAQAAGDIDRRQKLIKSMIPFTWWSMLGAPA